MTYTTVVNLKSSLFGARESVLVTHGMLSATAFRFDSGVCGLRLTNEVGHLVVLPFQGQQIWSAVFNGRALTMKSMFDEPRPTQEYLQTYGGFYLHCGATAMGAPSAEDTHPLHGELPNAPYQEAYVVVGQDDRGPYIGVGGKYQHTVAFTCNYVAEPLVKLYASSTVFPVSLTLTNLMHSEMEFMYLAHINFRPVDNGRLVYSAPPVPERVRVRTSIPTHIRPRPGYVEFIEELRQHPEKHHVLSSDLVFDPEVVFIIDYLADEEGWAHSMQVHPDGSADYIRHRPAHLDTGIRWISRTADQDALGIVLPATAGPEGYLAEKARGKVKVLPPLGRFHCDVEVGVLNLDEAALVEEKVARIVARWHEQGEEQ